MLLRHKHSPAAILLASLNVFFPHELIEQFLNGCDADACDFFHISQSKCRFCSHSIQNLCIIGGSECNALSIIPPHILIIFAYKQHIVINLCCNSCHAANAFLIFRYFIRLNIYYQRCEYIKSFKIWLYLYNLSLASDNHFVSGVEQQPINRGG